MDEKTETKRVVYSILNFLNDEFRKTTTSAESKESLEVAMQCLETAFSVNLSDNQYSVNRSLRELVLTSNEQASPSSSKTPTATATPTTPQAQVPAQEKPSNSLLGEPYFAPPPVNEEQKKEADSLKNQGNDKMKDGFYEEALELYSKSIEIDGGNAVYFCNRAATYLKLDRTNEALRDCQIAIQLQPTYARAYGRMGVAFSTLGNHKEAHNCYKKALEIEPGNDSYVNNMRVAQEMINDLNNDSENGATNPLIPGGSSLNELFRNPNLISMATQMLQDPSMQHMMRSIMSSFHNNGTEGNQNLDSFLQMGQAIANQIRSSNPNLAEQLGGNNNNGMNPNQNNQPNPRGPQGDM